MTDTGESAEDKRQKLKDAFGSCDYNWRSIEFHFHVKKNEEP